MIGDPSGRNETVDIASTEQLDRARRGDDAALSELWTIYQPQLLRLLRARRASTPEDVASQVWIDVSRSLQRFDGDGAAFRRWIFTIAGRRAIDEGRRVQRRGELSTDSLAQEPAGVCHDDRLDEAAAADRTLALIRQLSPVAAEVVLLRIVYDMPVGDVAAITGQTEANVRVLVHRGLAKLRQILSQHYAAAATPVPV